MDTSEVNDLVADLGDNLDDLETALAPLLTAALSATTSKLPLLDKAKLYVLATYAIESVLFSYLKINAAEVAQHPIAQELTRVKTYFQKVKEAELGPAQRTATLDKDAATRFIKHGLSGNERYDQARSERTAAEKAGAKRKADELDASAQWGSQNRFAGAAKRMRADEPGVAGVQRNGDGEGEDDLPDAENVRESTKEEKKAAKHQRRMERKQAKQSPVDEAVSADREQAAGRSTLAKQKSKKAPKDTHEAFESLLGKGQDEEDESGKKSKKKRKRRAEVQQELEDKRAREMM